MSNNDRPRAERNLPTVTVGKRTLTAYDPGLGLEVCEKIAEGGTLTEVLNLPGYPCRSTWYRWMMLYPDLATTYERARQISAEGLEEDMLIVAKGMLNSDAAAKFTPQKLDEIKTALTQYRWSAARRDPAKFAERPAANVIIPVQINTSLELGTDRTVQGSSNVYQIKVTRTVPDAAEDAEFEEVSPEQEAPAPERPPQPALSHAKPPMKRRLKKHKTPNQTRATIAAYAKRGMHYKEKGTPEDEPA